VAEPEVALAFTPDPWVEELHRHLTDHGGARVRSILVEPSLALEESYDVLIAGHRWPPLTRALVGDIQARGRAILGVFDREEPASRRHLLALGVDAVVESDAGPDGFVRAIVATAGQRHHRPPDASPVVEPRAGRLIAVGGAPGAGRTEIAIELARSGRRHGTVVLVDADDVGPAIAQRLHLPIEPNLRTAIDAIEHERGELSGCILDDAGTGLPVVGGVPNASAWAQVRPGEVLRVVDNLARTADAVVVDGAGALEDIGGSSTRGRYATARALVAEADALVAVADAAPHGIARLLAWVVDARALAPETPLVVVANRAPNDRFRRGELYDELTSTLAVHDVAFVPHDRHVADAAWSGTPARRGGFTRAVARIADVVLALPRQLEPPTALEIAS
jgi:MinD-like ATPase involved in chromosome partitioning or flagellar assembly